MNHDRLVDYLAQRELLDETVAEMLAARAIHEEIDLRDLSYEELELVARQIKQKLNNAKNKVKGGLKKVKNAGKAVVKKEKEIVNNPKVRAGASMAGKALGHAANLAG